MLRTAAHPQASWLSLWESCRQRRLRGPGSPAFQPEVSKGRPESPLAASAEAEALRGSMVQPGTLRTKKAGQIALPCEETVNQFSSQSLALGKV